MEHYRTDYRDELFTDTGGVKANKGDKYYARLPEKYQTENRSFSVWVKAIIRDCEEDKVWLEKVQKSGRIQERYQSKDSGRT